MCTTLAPALAAPTAAAITSSRVRGWLGLPVTIPPATAQGRIGGSLIRRTRALDQPQPPPSVRAGSGANHHRDRNIPNVSRSDRTKREGVWMSSRLVLGAESVAALRPQGPAEPPPASASGRATRATRAVFADRRLAVPVGVLTGA